MHPPAQPVDGCISTTSRGMDGTSNHGWLQQRRDRGLGIVGGDRMQGERNQRDTELVNATAKENMWAGVGGATLALCLQIAYRLASGLPIFIDLAIGWALLVGLAIFGLLSLARFSLDELRDSIKYLQMQGVMDEMAEELATKDATIAEQAREIQRLRAKVRGQEFKDASKQARNVVTAEETDTTKRLRNAERILERWASNNPYGRESMQMSRQDWEGAMALLQSAGAVGRGGAGGRQWVVTATNHAEALRLLRQRGEVWEQSENTTFVPA